MHLPIFHRRVVLTIVFILAVSSAAGFMEPTMPDGLKSVALPLPDEAAAQVLGDDTLSAEEAEQETLATTKEIVRSGDSMARIFARQGLTDRLLYLLSQTEHGDALSNIFAGEELSFETNDDGLRRLTLRSSPLEATVFEHRDGVFTSRHVVHQPDRVLAYQHGTISDSLFMASQARGLPDSLTMRFAQIFQWDIDFVLDIRPGDQFFVLYEELYFGGERVGFGDILVADFINQGRRHSGVLYRDTSGESGYFTPEGVSMRKAFLRAPVEFSRISSSFNLRRKHPLHNTVRPHRGIDYAAPTGTPILAAGDGKVLVASRTPANGRYLVLQHGQQFQTKYLHLSKFARQVRKGARVKQGQVIGYVGATGWATGPHLHYEFLVNGTHKNPRTVNLPKAAPVPKQELARFNSQTLPFSLLLDSYKEQVLLASAQ